MKTKLAACAWVALAVLIAQENGARELFYIAAAKKETLPKIRKQQDGGTSATAPTPAAVANLGLRYNLVLVEGTKSTPVYSEQNFRKGQCLAFQLEANRSGYLYVFARTTSGGWQPLLPSKEMAGESNVIDPGQKLQVPKDHCFEIDDPPGTETMFVVLSRDPADIYELNEGIKGRTPPSPGAMLLASATVNNEVERFSRALKDGDLIRSKIAAPARVGEPANSVYVVNKSVKPSTRVVTEIRVRHQ